VTLSIIAVLVGALVGAALGAVYLGLLWIAVRSLPQDRSGVLVFVGLGLARVALLVGALTAAAALSIPVEGMAAAVLGFIAARIVASRMVAVAPPKDTAWK